MLRALPGMKVAPRRGTRSFFVPPVKGIDATIAFAEWDHLQSGPDAPLRENNVIDQALAALEKWNAAHPEDPPVRLRLRVLTGIYAPDWAIERAGKLDVDFRKKPDSRAIRRPLPRFWSGAYHKDWSRFQQLLAAKYDSHPLLADVAISGCMTLHSEVIWRQPSYPHVLPTLVEAGLPPEKDLAALKRDITLMMDTWKATPLEMTFNNGINYRIQKGQFKRRKQSPELPKALLDHLAAEAKRTGQRYMVGNHSLSEFSVIEHQKHESPGHIHHTLKTEHATRKTPLYFQTEVFTAKIVEELIEQALPLGASLIELPNDIQPEQITTPSLQSLRTRLKANAK